MSQHDNAPAMEDAPSSPRRKSASRAVRAAWYCVLVIFGLVSISWPVYNKVEPAVWGIPFFLWFQFVWISLSAIATALAYKMRA